jgi:hypothetical protein
MPWNPAAVNVFEYSVSEAHGLSVEALEDQRFKAHHARALPVARNTRYSEMGHVSYVELAATAGAGGLKGER